MAVLASALVNVAHAAQILVGGGCTLPAAVVNANTNSKAGSYYCQRGTAGETDVIILPPEKIRLYGALEITDDVAILGGGGDWTILDGERSGRILDVAPNVSLRIRGVQLTGGAAADHGGAIRVQSGGRLDAEYLVIRQSVAGMDAVAGHGGAIYLADGVEASIRRSEVSGNSARGVGSSGGGIYCADGCNLQLSNSTVSGNLSDTMAAGLLVAGSAKFDFVTIAQNSSRSSAGIYLSGSMESFGTIVADNGGSGIGADLDCSDSGSTLRVEQTFVEMPSPSCAPSGAGMTTRVDLPATLPADVLYDTSYSPYGSSPSKVHFVEQRFAPFLQARISSSDARCARLIDQHGRARAAGIDCDLGALQSAMLSIWVMGFSVNSAEAGARVFVVLAEIPVSPVRVRVSPIAGIGEQCSGFETFVDFAPGQFVAELNVDPAQVFALPALNRPSRVCELAVEVVNGSAKSLGATAGYVRARVVGSAATTVGFSVPEPGALVDFTVVPVGLGGVRSLQLRPDTTVGGQFSVTGVTFVGADKDRFQVMSPAATETVAGSGVFQFSTPLAVLDRSVGGSALQVRCKPGVLGNFDAEMVVHTDSPIYQDVVYGVHCAASHLLSLAAFNSRIGENGSVAAKAVLSLDSPCLLDSDGFDNDDGDGVCLSVDYAEFGGDATSGEDYRAFGGSVVFAPGELQKVIDLIVLEDTLVEGSETFGMSVSLPAGVSNLAFKGDRAASFLIVDNDLPVREIKVFLEGIPELVGPAESVPFTVAVHNRSSEDLYGARVEVAVNNPMWLRSLALEGAVCTLSETRRRATCQIPDVLLSANQRPVGVDMAIDEADASRRDDSDWVRLYGRLVTADMKTAPVMDLEGRVSVSASLGTPVSSAAESVLLTIDAPPVSSFGGAPGLHWFLLLSWLPLRRPRRRPSVG